MTKRNPFFDFRITNKYPMICSGTMPNEDSEVDQFGAILNVSDSPGIILLPYSDQPRIWLPIMETAEWDLGTVFAALRTITEWRNDGRYVLVHCSAGVNRSVTIVNLWRWFNGDILTDDDRYMIDYNIRTGSLPENIEDLFNVMKDHPTWCAQACTIGANFMRQSICPKRRKQTIMYKRWGWFISIKNKMFPRKPIRL